MVSWISNFNLAAGLACVTLHWTPVHTEFPYWERNKSAVFHQLLHPVCVCVCPLHLFIYFVHIQAQNNTDLVEPVVNSVITIL